MRMTSEPVPLDGRWIVLDGGYTYECDLTQWTVDEWIDHVKEKRWWRYEWAATMRALARDMGFPAGEDTPSDMGVDDPLYRKYEAEVFPPNEHGILIMSAAELLDSPTFEEWKAASA